MVTNFINYQTQPRTSEKEWINKDIARSRAFLKEHAELIITRADKGAKTVIMHANEYRAKMSALVVGKTEYHVRNGFDFSNEITKIQIPEGYVMFSLDVVSLYTNVPVQKTYEIIEGKWGEINQHTQIPWLEFLRALKIVLEASFFQYNGKMYKQIFGVGMGSPLSGVVANILLEHLEKEVIAKLKTKGINLITYKRYVDKIDEIQNEFNQPFDSINFTVERETNYSIRFLDMTLTRNGNQINKNWFTKQLNGRYLDFSSSSPYAHKKNTAIALIDRALKLTDTIEREKSILTVKGILRCNNYPNDFIDKILSARVDAIYNSLKYEDRDVQMGRYASLTYIPHLSEKVTKILRKYDIIASSKPVNKIKDSIFTKLKDEIPKMKQTQVVYAIPCECGRVYCGQTSQTIEKRIKNHKYSFKPNASTTGLTQHAVENHHTFNYDDVKILEKVSDEGRRKIAETLHIKLRGERAVNIQRDAMEISSIYNALIKKLRGTPQFKSTIQPSIKPTTNQPEAHRDDG
ncbi:uncharacterized protein LOC129743037 [Uranotaenia lowii]|uniref:uncharacterized protein LOC129743037 n=1 Tax=Uranotaenia lowii TaxID=190385 RepID=UPI00247A7470|nr:uncharacterized protein LOC129743037 [Uranotaenia lowii]